MAKLVFDQGTLLLSGLSRGQGENLAVAGLRYDSRVHVWRLPAFRYREAITRLKGAGVEVEDCARGYDELSLPLRLVRTPYPFQKEAVAQWSSAGGRGVVVLPTGAGKTYVAQLILERIGRSTLVVTPTLDLMFQWVESLAVAFDLEIGVLGGGSRQVEAVTVATYDSAYLNMERLGHCFGLMVFDECHHLPSAAYSFAAEGSIAPYRLGLTATPERDDRGEDRIGEIVGPVVFRKDVKDLAGRYLSDYETIGLRVGLSDAERVSYEENRKRFLDFVRRHRIALGSPGGWNRFLQASSRTKEGRRAFLAYRAQKRTAEASEAKLRLLERLLHRHRQDRVLVFTSDNDTVYRISRRFLIPAITHQTRVSERREILAGLQTGEYPFVATSRVLNEGVDVPAANVAVVLSGSGSTREHVQRLGRILRRAEGKRAVLYEVVTQDTAEEGVSSRRRRHDAYR